MENIDVVRKLIGNIKPVGETHADNQCYINLREMTFLVSELLCDIEEVVEYMYRHESSMAQCGKFAKGFFKHIKEEFELLK